MEIDISLENFEIYIIKSQWKIDFLPIFYLIFQDLCQFIDLLKITPFLYNIFLFVGEASHIPLRATLKAFEDKGKFRDSYLKPLRVANCSKNRQISIFLILGEILNTQILAK